MIVKIGVIFKTIARVARLFLIAMCLGCLTAPAQQDAPANSSEPTSTSAPPRAELQPEAQTMQDQNRVQNRVPDEVPDKARNDDPAKSRTETKTQPHPRAAKKQNNAGLPNPNHRSSRAAAARVPTGAPKKVVVRHGGAEEPTAQIVTGMTAEESDRQRREADLLLSTTEEKLKEIAPRPLDAQQQETVAQIHNYMESTRSALKQGDVSRAHTLAQKAGLLADDLAGH